MLTWEVVMCPEGVDVLDAVEGRIECPVYRVLAASEMLVRMYYPRAIRIRYVGWTEVVC
jgi:hypothetical protein